MLRKVFIVAALALVPALTSVANAQYKQGDWDLQLAGTGMNNRAFTSATFGVDAGVGYLVTQNLEVSLRQTVGYTHLRPASEVWTAGTDLAVDWNFDLGKFVPFAGANIGYNYGTHGYKDTWELAPEAGVKFFVNSTTYIVGMAQYQILFNNGSQVAFNKGLWVYSLGLGVRL